jgi:hypothetical protein
VPGNHEYETSGASGYYGFFDSINVPHGEDGKGWYSFDVGSWHLIGLNSSNACSPVSCAQGSAQETWLKADLAATNQPCILAFLHHPLSTVSGKLRPLWQDLYDAGADLVLDGHVHGYTDKGNEAPDGSSDPAGPREIVVGTGGKSSGKYGLLRLTLGTGSVSWVFVGSGTSASGSAACHTAGGSPPPPPPPPPPWITSAKNDVAPSAAASPNDRCTWSVCGFEPP